MLFKETIQTNTTMVTESQNVYEREELVTKTASTDYYTIIIESFVTVQESESDLAPDDKRIKVLATSTVHQQKPLVVEEVKTGDTSDKCSI